MKLALILPVLASLTPLASTYPLAQGLKRGLNRATIDESVSWALEQRDAVNQSSNGNQKGEEVNSGDAQNVPTQADVDALNTITPEQWEEISHLKIKRQEITQADARASTYIPERTPGQIQATHALSSVQLTDISNSQEKTKREPQNNVGIANLESELAKIQAEMQGEGESTEAGEAQGATAGMNTIAS